MRCSLLVSASVMVLFLLGVGAVAAAAANGRREAVGSGAGAGASSGKAKAGLGATGSDVITITGKNFKETVSFFLANNARDLKIVQYCCRSLRCDMVLTCGRVGCSLWSRHHCKPACPLT